MSNFNPELLRTIPWVAIGITVLALFLILLGLNMKFCKFCEIKQENPTHKE